MTSKREETLAKIVSNLEEECERLRSGTVSQEVYLELQESATRYRRNAEGYRDEARRLRETLRSIQRQGLAFYQELGRQLDAAVPSASISSGISDAENELACKTYGLGKPRPQTKLPGPLSPHECKGRFCKICYPNGWHSSPVIRAESKDEPKDQEEQLSKLANLKGRALLEALAELTDD